MYELSSTSGKDTWTNKDADKCCNGYKEYYSSGRYEERNKGPLEKDQCSVRGRFFVIPILLARMATGPAAVVITAKQALELEPKILLCHTF